MAGHPRHADRLRRGSRHREVAGSGSSRSCCARPSATSSASSTRRSNTKRDGRCARNLVFNGIEYAISLPVANVTEVNWRRVPLRDTSTTSSTVTADSSALVLEAKYTDVRAELEQRGRTPSSSTRARRSRRWRSSAAATSPRTSRSPASSRSSSCPTSTRLRRHASSTSTSTARSTSPRTSARRGAIAHSTCATWPKPTRATCSSKGLYFGGVVRF